MSSSLDASIDPKQYARMFWRRKGVIVLCATTVICTAIIALEFVPKEYEAEASLMIEERQKLSSQIEDVMGGMGPGTGGGYRVDEKRMDKLVGRVRSRPFLEKVVRLLRMHEDPQVLAQADLAIKQLPDVTREEMATRIIVSQLRPKIRFEMTGSGIYKIIVADHVPENAQLLARWISEVFVDVSAQGTLDELKRSHDFGAEQLKIYEEKVRTSELALQRYQASQIEADLSRNFVREGNVSVAEALYQRVLDEAEMARMRVLPLARDVTDAGLDARKNAVLNDADVQRHAEGLASTLKEALTDRLVGEARSAGEWPPTGSYADLRRGLLQLIERNSAADPEGSDERVVRAVFATLDHRAHSEAATELGQAIALFKTRAQSKPRGEMELSRLEAELANNRTLLRSFEAQLVASEVTQAMEMTDLGLRIEILDPPQLPFAPARPNRQKIMMAAMLMGPLIGAGIAFATELLDTTLRTMRDFQRVFDMPVLGTTPLLSRMDLSGGGVRRYWVQVALSGVLLVTLVFFLTRDTLVAKIAQSASHPVQVIDPDEAVNR